MGKRYIFIPRIALKCNMLGSPARVMTKIDYNIIFIIIACVLIFQVILYVLDNSDYSNDLVAAVSMSCRFAVGITGIIVSLRYKLSSTLGKAFFALSLGYLSLFCGEISWFINEEIIHIDTFPSYSDVFFFGIYPFAAIHLILNIKLFAQKFSSKDLSLISIIIGIFVGAYVYFAIQLFGGITFEVIYGLPFVIGSAVILGLAAFGANLFRYGTIGISWFLLVIGIFSNTIGDVWYYYLELLDQYDTSHVVNLFWYASSWLVIYSLIKHKEAF